MQDWAEKLASFKIKQLFRRSRIFLYIQCTYIHTNIINSYIYTPQRNHLLSMIFFRWSPSKRLLLTGKEVIIFSKTLLKIISIHHSISWFLVKDAQRTCFFHAGYHITKRKSKVCLKIGSSRKPVTVSHCSVLLISHDYAVT